MMKVRIFKPQPYSPDYTTTMEYNCPYCNTKYTTSAPLTKVCIECDKIIISPKYLLNDILTRKAFHMGRITT